MGSNRVCPCVGVTMDPQFPGFDPSPLIPYLKSLGIPYFFESQALLDDATATNPKSICAWCSRMKRGILYSCARREKYNVLALGQHLDDLVRLPFCAPACLCRPPHSLLAFY